MKRKVIFIFAYYSYKDPVFQSAVLPYFIMFPEKEKFIFVLLTFEQRKYRTNQDERTAIAAHLKQNNIVWYNVNWHSGRFKVIKKVYDFIVAITLSAWIIYKHKVDIIYSEAFPGAIISHILSRVFSKPHIVHTFEPHTDYMVEGGVWANTSWESRLLLRFERKVAKKASVIMTATGAMIERLRNEGVKANIIRVPSCVDLQHFKFMPHARSHLRKSLGIDEGECVIIYIGKMGGMYWEEEIFKFFAVCLSVSSTFRFLFYTPDDPEKVQQLASKYAIPNDKLSYGFLSRDEVPQYLSAADFGLVPVRQYSSKRFCSPIKDGEYWACGLPIIIPSGVSDDYIFAREKNIGLVLDEIKDTSFEKVAVDILRIWKDTPALSVMRNDCREFVEKDRSIAFYQEFYKDVFDETA